MSTNPGSEPFPPPATLYHSGGCFMRAPPSTTNLDTMEENRVSFSMGPLQQGESVSTEPSAVLLISPRALQSQPGPDMLMELEEIETFVFPMDETNQSVISIRVSRGKSQVNLSDPSRTHRRAGPRVTRILPVASPIDVLQIPDHRSVVKFKSELDREFETHPPGENPNDAPNIQPKNPIFPSPILERPFSNLKSDYDFYTPGQTMEAVKVKLERMKVRMSKLRDILRKKENSLKEMYLVSGEVSNIVEENVSVSNKASAHESTATADLSPSTLITGTLPEVTEESENTNIPCDSDESTSNPACIPPEASSTGISEEQKAGSTAIPLETSDAGTSENE